MRASICGASYCPSAAIRQLHIAMAQTGLKYSSRGAISISVDSKATCEVRESVRAITAQPFFLQ